MKITICGGSGFLGSHIADELSNAEHEVTIFDIKDSPWKNINQEMLVGSLLDKKAINEAVKDSDYVFNFAGIADIADANINPHKSAEVNILGNLNLLDACYQAKIKRYIFASSLYVYSNAGGFYRCSKQACEVYIEEYQRQFGLDYTILRFGSLYGCRTNEQNAIYSFIKEELTEKKIRYYGSPDSLREYIHAEDAALICCDILDKKFTNQHITITGHQSIRVGDVLNMIKEIIGEDITLEYNTHADSSHYEITPYAFNPKLGKKYSPELHTDLGQGLLQIMNLVHKEILEK